MLPALGSSAVGAAPTASMVGQGWQGLYVFSCPGSSLALSPIPDRSQSKGLSLPLLLHPPHSPPLSFPSSRSASTPFLDAQRTNETQFNSVNGQMDECMNRWGGSLVEDPPDRQDPVVGVDAGVVGRPVADVGVVGTVVVGGVAEGAAVVVVGVVGGDDGPGPGGVPGETGPDGTVVDEVVPLAEVVHSSVEVARQTLLGVGAPATLGHVGAHVRLSVELGTGGVLGDDHLGVDHAHLLAIHAHLLHVLGLALLSRHARLLHRLLLLGGHLVRLHLGQQLRLGLRLLLLLQLRSHHHCQQHHGHQLPLHFYLLIYYNLLISSAYLIILPSVINTMQPPAFRNVYPVSPQTKPTSVNRINLNHYTPKQQPYYFANKTLVKNQQPHPQSTVRVSSAKAMPQRADVSQDQFRNIFHGRPRHNLVESKQTNPTDRTMTQPIDRPLPNENNSLLPQKVAFLQAELEQRNRRIQELEEKNEAQKDLETIIELMEKEISQYKRQQQHTQTAYQNSIIEQNYQEITNQKKQIDLQNQKIVELQKQLQARGEKEQMQVRDQGREIEELRQQVSGQAGQYEQKVNMLISEIERLNAIMQGRQDDKAQLNMKVHSLEETVQRQLGEIRQNRLAQQNQQIELHQHTAQVDQAQQETLAYQTQVEQLLQQNQHLLHCEATAKGQEAEIQEYKNRLRLLAEEVERLNAFLLQRGEELDKALQTNFQLQGQAKQLSLQSSQPNFFSNNRLSLQSHLKPGPSRLNESCSSISIHQPSRPSLYRPDN